MQPITVMKVVKQLLTNGNVFNANQCWGLGDTTNDDNNDVDTIKNNDNADGDTTDDIGIANNDDTCITTNNSTTGVDKTNDIFVHLTNKKYTTDHKINKHCDISVDILHNIGNIGYDITKDNGKNSIDTTKTNDNISKVVIDNVNVVNHDTFGDTTNTKKPSKRCYVTRFIV